MIRNMTPCVDCCGEVPPCCPWSSLPATATLSLSVDGFAVLTNAMARIPVGYSTVPPTVICDLGDGHTKINLDVSIICTGGFTWGLDITYSVYTDDVLGNYTTWHYVWNTGDTPTEVLMSCSPFHVHFDGMHTGSVDGDGATLACGGRTYKFNAVPGSIRAVLDIVTP